MQLTEDDFTFNEDNGKLEIDMKRFGYKTGPMKKQIIEDSEKWNYWEGIFQIYNGGIKQFFHDFLNDNTQMQKKNKEYHDKLEEIKSRVLPFPEGHCDIDAPEDCVQAVAEIRDILNITTGEKS